MMEEPVRVMIAPNEVAADVVCTFLRAEGILCNHRVTNLGAGSWDGVPNAGGPREVLVDPADLDAAREALASAELGEFSDCACGAVAVRCAASPPAACCRRAPLRDGLLVVAAELLAHRR